MRQKREESEKKKRANKEKKGHRSGMLESICMIKIKR